MFFVNKKEDNTIINAEHQERRNRELPTFPRHLNSASLWAEKKSSMLLNNNNKCNGTLLTLFALV